MGAESTFQQRLSLGTSEFFTPMLYIFWSVTVDSFVLLCINAPNNHLYLLQKEAKHKFTAAEKNSQHTISQQCAIFSHRKRILIPLSNIAYMTFDLFLISD